MRLPRAAFLVLVSLGLAGCGSSEGKTVSVRGKLTTKDGAPFRVSRPGNAPLPPGDPGIRIKFSRADGSESETFAAAVNPAEATFEVPGANRKGIPPGKYLAIVSVGAAGGEKDTQNGPQGRPGDGPRSMDGKEVARQEVTVPDEGLTDLTITIERQP